MQPLDAEPAADAAEATGEDATAAAAAAAEPAADAAADAAEAAPATDGGDISDGYGVIKPLPGKASAKVVNTQVTADELYIIPAEAPASTPTTKVRVFAQGSAALTSRSPSTAHHLLAMCDAFHVCVGVMCSK